MRSLRKAIEGVLPGAEREKIDDIMQLVVAQREY